jgi:hypothetical protein
MRERDVGPEQRCLKARIPTIVIVELEEDEDEASSLGSVNAGWTLGIEAERELNMMISKLICGEVMVFRG